MLTNQDHSNSSLVNVYSVSDLTSSVAKLLDKAYPILRIEGEISDFKKYSSGHYYFKLKDKNSQVSCAFFAGKNRLVRFELKNDIKVIVDAKVTLYANRGDFQLIIEKIELSGQGLYEFEKLKNKLTTLGFIDRPRKKINKYIQKIGVVTSLAGAALQDIIKVITRRNPHVEIVIYPTSVQGEKAPQEIVKAIEIANIRDEVEVLIVGRGGGSFEDLNAFNQENVAMAIINSKLPIVSAVGHETDITISDLVADFRAPTPSAAAEEAIFKKDDFLTEINNKLARLQLTMDYFCMNKSKKINDLFSRLQYSSPQNRLLQRQHNYEILSQRLQQGLLHKFSQQQNNYQQQLSRMNTAIDFSLKSEKSSQSSLINRLYSINLSKVAQNYNNYYQQYLGRMNTATDFSLKSEKQRYVMLCARLDSLSPLKVLSRGYNVSFDNKNQAIKTVKSIEIGQKIKSKFSDGEIISNVVEINKKILK